ncbi:hypothetical protein G6011_09483 [Alternaria panax]|uniref:Uncharacterized protein n=1 Tax=Alternaria panax TaxID=48097 RepID=A0AAD4NRF1_9PLEO|nr:hypothetical protein G6011_09483 [Alternaria panax]
MVRLDFLQWGFSKRPGSDKRYVDIILGVGVKKKPDVTSLSSFSHMAWEANLCVGKISKVQTECAAIVPKALQGEYLDAFRKLQRVAAAFTLLENLSSRRITSDLDIFLDCARIASYLSDESEETDAQEIDRMRTQLDVAKGVCVGLLDYVLGFTFTLKTKDLETSTYNNLGKFKSWWAANHPQQRSNEISTQSAKWNTVKEAVSACRATQTRPKTEVRARRAIKDFNRRENEKVIKQKTELTKTLRAGCIELVTVSGLRKNRVSRKFGM